MMAVFIPPAILHEVEAIFDLPVTANPRQQFRGRDLLRIEARNEIAAFARKHVALGRTHCAIHANQNSAVGNVQALADMFGVVEVEPEAPRFFVGPLFSVVSQRGGRSTASAKQA